VLITHSAVFSEAYAVIASTVSVITARHTPSPGIGGRGRS
jgi:hypothetical protein